MPKYDLPPMNIPRILEGKNIAITGATTGIGYGMSLALAKAGAKLCVLSLPSELGHADELRKEVAKIRGDEEGFVVFEGDVSQQQTAVGLVKKTVEAFGQIDVMIANAGICQYKDFFETEAELYYKHVRVNLDGVYFMVQEAGRQMRDQGKGGSIICTGSIRSLLGGANLVPYTATKGGVLSIVQAAAAALGPYNVRVNCILPGAVMTPIMEQNATEEECKKIVEKIPMNRMAVPEDLGGPAVFLASDMSRFLNGSEMLVDGGQYINLE